MVLNFNNLNSIPFNPTLFWEYRTGLESKITISNEIIGKIIRNIGKAINKRKKSIKYFITLTLNKKN